MNIFEGKKHSKILDEKIKTYLKTNPNVGTLGIVQIGDDPGSNKYIELKQKYCDGLGIKTKLLKFKDDLPDENVFNRVEEFFADKQVTGGLIQLPLPRDTLNKIVDLIPQEKDIDVLSSQCTTQYYEGDFLKLSPVVRAFEYFLEENQIKIDGKKCLVLGRGVLIGRPIVEYLNHYNAQTDILSKYSTGTPLNCHLLVLGAGIPNLVMGEDIKSGCSVVDFGYSVVGGRSVGDLCLDSNLNHLGIISPSPGGLGPLVIRFLIMNFLGI